MGIQCTVINFLHSKYLVNSVIITQWTKKKKRNKIFLWSNSSQYNPFITIFVPLFPISKKKWKSVRSIPSNIGLHVNHQLAVKNVYRNLICSLKNFAQGTNQAWLFEPWKVPFITWVWFGPCPSRYQSHRSKTLYCQANHLQGLLWSPF